MRAVLPVVMAIVLGGGCQLMSSRVEIWNKSGVAVNNVDITVGDTRQHVKAIAPNGDATILFTAPQDSFLGVDFQLGAETTRRSCKKGYVMGGSYEKLVVVLNPDGGCQVL